MPRKRRCIVSSCASVVLSSITATPRAVHRALMRTATMNVGAVDAWRDDHDRLDISALCSAAISQGSPAPACKRAREERKFSGSPWMWV